MRASRMRLICASVCSADMLRSANAPEEPMARADGFMIVPSDCPGIAAGDRVTVQLFDSAALQENMGFEE